MAPSDKELKEQERIRGKSKTREVSRKLHARIVERFGNVVELVDAVDPYSVVLDPARFLDVMHFLKEDPELRFDFLRSITAVDWPADGIVESVYHLYSYETGLAHVVKLRCDRKTPEAPSVVPLWPVANWFEREAYDLNGVIYLGHPDLRRLMLPDDWVGHPLQKDYAESEDYHGIGTTRASPLDAFQAMDEARKKARDARGEKVVPITSSIKPPPGFEPPKKKGAAAKEEEE
jgi:NADH-quinone oxidoreductase subunit C